MGCNIFDFQSTYTGTAHVMQIKIKVEDLAQTGDFSSQVRQLPSRLGESPNRIVFSIEISDRPVSRIPRRFGNISMPHTFRNSAYDTETETRPCWQAP